MTEDEKTTKTSSDETVDKRAAPEVSEQPEPGFWSRIRALKLLQWRTLWIILAIPAGLILMMLFYAVITRFVMPPTTFTMIDRALSGERVRRDAVPLGKISPHLVNAVIAAEDSRFCEHDGFDMDAIRKAIKDHENGAKLRGASTISQQTAKNVFLWNGGGFVRKGAEAGMTLVIETIWGKKRIMEVYLNVAEWGDGIFGAEAAAQARFGKSASELTAREAALLASVLPSPNKWRIDPPGAYVSGRASMLQKRMSVVANDHLSACVLGG